MPFGPLAVRIVLVLLHVSGLIDPPCGHPLSELSLHPSQESQFVHSAAAILFFFLHQWKSISLLLLIPQRNDIFMENFTSKKCNTH